MKIDTLEVLKVLDEQKGRDQYSTGGTGEPWYTRGAINILETILQPNFEAFEFGSGASTIWIAQRVKFLTTVEHDPIWYDRVKKALEVTGLKEKVELRKEILGSSYENAINSCLDSSLDAVFIDGRERIACIQNSIPKLKSGGVLCLDNADRGRYGPGVALMEGWDNVIASNTGWKTGIWTKP